MLEERFQQDQSDETKEGWKIGYHQGTIVQDAQRNPHTTATRDAAH